MQAPSSMLNGSSQPYIYGVLPFAIDWEVWRVDRHKSLDLENGGEWQKLLQSNIENPKIIWDILRNRFASVPNLESVPMPEISSARAWDSIQSKGWADGQVHLKLKVDILPNRTIIYTPLPMAVSSSKRAYRKFGADRFLSATVAKSIVRMHPRELKVFLKTPLTVCGRSYRVFFVRATQEALNVHYFATHGAGLRSSINIDTLMEWLLSINNNCTKIAPKLWSRISLSLSSTTPSIEFTPDQIRLVPDIVSPTGQCMTDGCARASPAVFREVWLSGVLASKETPTAIQGRIGGAKGVWFVDPLIDYRSEEKWVEIRPSQLKFKYDPITFTDPMLRTLVSFLNCHRTHYRIFVKSQVAVLARPSTINSLEFFRIVEFPRKCSRVCLKKTYKSLSAL